MIRPSTAQLGRARPWAPDAQDIAIHLRVRIARRGATDPEALPRGAQERMRLFFRRVDAGLEANATENDRMVLAIARRAWESDAGAHDVQNADIKHRCTAFQHILRRIAEHGVVLTSEELIVANHLLRLLQHIANDGDAEASVPLYVSPSHRMIDPR